MGAGLSREGALTVRVQILTRRSLCRLNLQSLSIHLERTSTQRWLLATSAVRKYAFRQLLIADDRASGGPRDSYH
jgi:hypothetical protein